jgi:glycosyltransferase involved in cell wall biosynthesis
MIKVHSCSFIMTTIAQRKKNPSFQLVFTVALKKEMPRQWLDAHDIPVYTLEALKSGAIGLHHSPPRGVLIVITGAGPRASEKAACWLRDHVTPIFVINIGTCGLTDQKLPIAEWILPKSVSNEDGDTCELDTRFPISLPEGIIQANSLLSVEKPILDIHHRTLGNHDALDMECFAQAKVFRNTPISFHCLKFGTDYSDGDTHTDFNRNIGTLTEKLKDLLSFLTQRARIGLTAIIPVFNRQNTIERALRSVFSQTYQPEEVIVVDDGSHDRTGEILERYRDKITVIVLPENSGPSRARNTGAYHAQTEWVAFLDSDDLWKEDKLQKQVEFLRCYPFYEILQSDEVWMRNGKWVNPCKHHEKPFGWIWEPSLQRCLVSPSSVLIKKSLLQRYHFFDETLPVCEDYDLWLKISRHHPVGLEPALTVVKYGGHRDQLSQKYPAMDRFRVRSLMNMLEGERVPCFQEKIIRVLEKKLKILIQGYEKRLKLREAVECRTILESLKSCQESTKIR